jgi:hypothetical protein
MSEFGKGFTYCIGLFLAHSERAEVGDYSLWFNGATDHLYELEIPDNFILKEECKDWQKKCLEWRMEPYTKENKGWAINKAKRFLLAWDNQNNVICEEGEWE